MKKLKKTESIALSKSEMKKITGGGMQPCPYCDGEATDPQVGCIHWACPACPECGN